LTLFSPESHESLMGTPWDADRVRSAIAGVVAGVEAAFDDGWLVHPADDHDSLTTKRLRVARASSTRCTAWRGATSST
jgi:hypothetical protein